MSLPLVFALQPGKATGLLTDISYSVNLLSLLAHLGPHSNTPPKTTIEQ